MPAKTLLKTGFSCFPDVPQMDRKKSVNVW